MKAKHLAAEEDGRDDATAEITREVGADAVPAKAPDHAAVREADGVGGRVRGDEGVGGIEGGPDDERNVGVDEELDEEEIAQVGLVGRGDGDERRCGAGAGDETVARGERLGLEGGDLLVVLPHEHDGGHEGAEDLRHDEVGHFAPGEALPVRETERDGGVEVSAGSGRADDDGEGDAGHVCEADGEEVAERRRERLLLRVVCC